MRIAVIGASGYVASRLVPRLLDDGHAVTAVARRPEAVHARPWANRVKVVEADVTEGRAITSALNGATAAVYLVHAMADGGDFVAREEKGARTFGEAARLLGIEHVVYLGGLGSDEELSRHLGSRQMTGKVLADNGPATTELRASIVLGTGSASYELVRMAADASVVLPQPLWARHLCQPIGIDDLLDVFSAVVAEGPRGQHVIREVGGPEVLPYVDVVQRHREARERSRLPVVDVFVPREIAAFVGGRAAPLPTELVRPLVRSLAHDTIIEREDTAMVGSLTVREACERAIDGDGAAGPMAGDPPWAGAGVPELVVRRALAALSLDRLGIA